MSKKRLVKDQEPIQKLELKRLLRNCFTNIAKGKRGYGERLKNDEVKLLPIVCL